MDFWDIFINQESTANTLLIEALDENYEDFHNNIDNYQLFIYTDFVNITEIDKDELIAAIALLNNIDKVQGADLTAAAVTTLIKFYRIIFSDFREIGENLLRILDMKTILFKENELLLKNFENAKETYNNFADAEDIDVIKQVSLKGKLVCIYKNNIMVFYLKEEL